jgi:adenylate kinase family enzyme
MRVLMIAPPGAGKGTQGALIAAHFGIPHIATGELLRDHVARRTSLGLAVQELLDRGELVPDRIAGTAASVRGIRELSPLPAWCGLDRGMRRASRTVSPTAASPGWF